MGFKTAGLIRISGLENGTDVDVLEAIATFLNEETGQCFPALESVMLVARKSRNVVRQSIKDLCAQGLLSFSAEPGKVRTYGLNVAMLPKPKIDGLKKLFEMELGKRGQKITGFRSEPGNEVNREGVQKCTPTGFRSEPPPGSEVNPEQGNNKEENKEENKESSMRTSGKTSAIASVASAQAQTPYPEDFDQSLFDEAQREAQLAGEKPTDEPPRKEEKPKRKRTSVARPDGVSEQVWEDFSALRTKRRAPITETALKGIQREAEKAGITLEAALSTCCERGWQGFKAEWYRREKLEQKNASKAEYQLPSNDDWDNFDTAHYA